MNLGIGVVGAGYISDTYLTNLTRFSDVDVRYIADLDPERAAAQAAKHGVAASGTTAELLARGDIDIVVNLTIPAAHAEVGTAVLKAGKHLWQEKPLATTLTDAAELLTLAQANGLRVGCAPDTVLGPGIQAARRAIASGVIGTPQTGLAVFQSGGPDAWHPSPEFLFQAGGGPLFDMGPYYLTTLALIFGPVRRVTAVSTRARTRRTIQAGPRTGTGFDVTEPTTVGALIEFRDGGSAQLVMSFDSGISRTGIEITGELGSIVLPDPNRFDGDTTVHPLTADDPDTITPYGHSGTRGIGVLELARSIHNGTPERAGGELAHHVVEVMTGIDAAAKHGRQVVIDSTFDAGEPLPADWDPFAASD